MTDTPGAESEPNLWRRLVAADPGHSQRYRDRFVRMAAQGADLVGEARLVDAMVGRGARVLDAGCGPGRVGGHLASVGHTVVGVDLDPVLIAAAQADHPGATWRVGDLARLDAVPEAVGPFDAIVCAGNVMTFLDPATRRDVLAGFLSRLGSDGAGGRAVIGFGAGRGYPFDEFRSDAAAVGLRADLLLATWDLRPFTPESDFLVAVLSAE